MLPCPVLTTKYHEKTEQSCANMRYQNVDRTTSFCNIETCKNRTLFIFSSMHFIRYYTKSFKEKSKATILAIP